MPAGPEIGDAFGQMIRDCHAAGAAPWAVPEIIERDDGQIDAADAGRYFAPPEDEFDSWPLAPARGSVLDIGAGTGRYALPLQERGHQVTALDVSAGGRSRRLRRARRPEPIPRHDR